jgi:hypothetical protein
MASVFVRITLLAVCGVSAACRVAMSERIGQEIRAARPYEKRTFTPCMRIRQGEDKVPAQKCGANWLAVTEKDKALVLAPDA